MRCLDDITDSMYMSLSKLWEIESGKPGVLQSIESQRVRHDSVSEQQQQQSNLCQGLRGFEFWIV